MRIHEGGRLQDSTDLTKVSKIHISLYDSFEKIGSWERRPAEHSEEGQSCHHSACTQFELGTSTDVSLSFTAEEGQTGRWASNHFGCWVKHLS